MNHTADFELIEDRVRLTSFVFSVTIFFDPSPNQRAEQVLDAWRAYQMVPAPEPLFLHYRDDANAQESYEAILGDAARLAGA